MRDERGSKNRCCKEGKYVELQDHRNRSSEGVEHRRRLRHAQDNPSAKVVDDSCSIRSRRIDSLL